MTELLETLTLRNLTGSTAELTHIDCLDTSNLESQQRDRLLGPVRIPWRSANNDGADPKPAKAQEGRAVIADREAYNGALKPGREAVHLVLEAYATMHVRIPAARLRRLRLDLKSHDGSSWHIELSGPVGHAAKITSDNTDVPYTVIYDGSSTTIAIFDQYDTRRWMQVFTDDTSLSALSIPGTHNSPTCYPALPSVRCQEVPVATQLLEGVRYLDIRVQLDDVSKGTASHAMQLVHAVFPISFHGPKLFSALISDVYDFLEKHPSETIIMSLKREGRGSGTDALFAERLEEYYMNSRYWHTASGIPSLGEVRGKIVVLRRFELGATFSNRAFGIDATNWADNHTNHLHGDIHIQDFYNVTSTRGIAKKADFVMEHLARSRAVVHSKEFNEAAVDSRPLFINHLSANNFWTPGCWPDKVAAKVNPAVLSFLCKGHTTVQAGLGIPDGEVQGDGGLGVVVCDWVGGSGNWDLVRAIIGTNSRLLSGQQKRRYS
ncbi:Putative phosphatidylinositol-specific phospholipase C, X domain-containing protein [Septoria linicola]|uniref:Phosphatidylinositol-specific phospholipase C, X domain-containing protein n=1 Tax=Septoria linicola TaxID=215465 RepID=A0A9Q9AQC1_9PEZI|nr:putative phosphatidylinositol-specific phospholipase C, X domain-containing protein [Septoria linicola]USW50278.1 Putative phosphatidylinositol-specific phospholipase C, X domain-containing protein [Septoria linicola]